MQTRMDKEMGALTADHEQNVIYEIPSAPANPTLTSDMSLVDQRSFHRQTLIVPGQIYRFYA